MSLGFVTTGDSFLFNAANGSAQFKSLRRCFVTLLASRSFIIDTQENGKDLVLDLLQRHLQEERSWLFDSLKVINVRKIHNAACHQMEHARFLPEEWQKIQALVTRPYIEAILLIHVLPCARCGLWGPFQGRWLFPDVFTCKECYWKTVHTRLTSVSSQEALKEYSDGFALVSAAFYRLMERIPSRTNMPQYATENNVRSRPGPSNAPFYFLRDILRSRNERKLFI